MKLIFCTSCNDLFRLMRAGRCCTCGRSYGRYLEDGLNAIIGGDAIPVGISNTSLNDALQKKRHGAGMTVPISIDAFLIEDQCTTIKVIERRDEGEW